MTVRYSAHGEAPEAPWRRPVRKGIAPGVFVVGVAVHVAIAVVVIGGAIVGYGVLGWHAIAAAFAGVLGGSIGWLLLRRARGAH